MAFSPLVSTVGDLCLRMLKGQPRLYITFHLHFASIFFGLKDIPFFSFGLDFSIWGFLGNF